MCGGFCKNGDEEMTIDQIRKEVPEGGQTKVVKMKFDDSFLYSRGVYWLFEHWQEDGKNIYSKSKYPTKDSFLKGAGKRLTSDDIEKLKSGKSITIDQPNGTKFFFKFVNLP